MKTAKNNVQFLLLQCINIILAGCTIYGYAPIGIGYFAALYMKKQWRAVTFATAFLGLAYTIPYTQCVKYLMVMGVYAVLVGILEMNKNREPSPYIYGAIAAVSIAALETADRMFAYQNTSRDIATVLGVCVLGGSILVVFSRGIDGIIHSGENQDIQNEEMIGIATICGICACYLVTKLDIPYSLLETGIYFLLLYFTYKYGAGLGAIFGAGLGISMGIRYEDVAMVSILCVTAIIAGGLGELGKAAAVISMLCSLTVGGLVFAPDFLNEANVQGMLTSSIIFLILPAGVIYRREQEKQRAGLPRDEIVPDKVNRLVSEKLRSLSESLDMIYGQFKSSAEQGNIVEAKSLGQAGVRGGKGQRAETGAAGDYRRVNEIWQGRLKDVKDNVMLQLGEISALLEDYSGNEKIPCNDSRRKKITRKLRAKGVVICEMQQHKNPSGVNEVEMTVKCAEGKTITTREICEVIGNVTGKEFVPEKSDSRVIGSRYSTLTFRQKENFKLSYGVAKSVKGGGKISGDNQSMTEIGRGKWVLTLADGMGSGLEAFKESEGVVEFLEKMMTLGFRKESAIQLINSIKSMNWEEEKTTAVDMGVMDMYSGVCNFVKMGAASTFIKRNKWVDVIKSTSLPVGIVEEADIDSATKKLYVGDMVVMISDGVADGIREENKEMAISRILLDYQEDNPKELADKILEKAMEDSCYTPTDDMTVVVAAVCENAKSA